MLEYYKYYISEECIMQVVVMIINISAIKHKCNSQFRYVIDFNVKGKIIYKKTMTAIACCQM